MAPRTMKPKSTYGQSFVIKWILLSSVDVLGLIQPEQIRLRLHLLYFNASE